MKNLQVIIVMMGLLFSTQSFGQLIKAELRATGLTCSLCSNAINNQLKNITELDSIAVDFSSSTYLLFFKKNNHLQAKNLKEKVEKAGFFVGSLQITMATKDVKNASNLVFLDKENALSDDEIQLKIYDKGYVTQKEYQKFSKEFAKVPTYFENNENDYHVKIVEE